MKLRFLLFLLPALPILVSAKTFTSNQSGLWNNTTIWTITGNGGNNTWPQTGDNVVILPGHTVMLNVNIGDVNAQNGIQSLVVNFGGKLLWDSTLNNNAGFLLFASGGSFTIDGSARVRCFKLKNNAGVSVVSATGSFTARDCSYIEKDIQINGTATFSGTVDLSGGNITTTTGSGAVTFGTGSTLTGTGTVFNITTTTINTQLGTGGGLSVSGFTWKGTGTSAWNTAGNWSGNAVPTSTSAVSIMSGTGAQPAISVAAACKTLTANNNCSITINSGGSLSVTDSIDLKSGTVPATLTINNGGSFTAGGLLRLEPGTAVNLNGNATVTTNGSLNLSGTAAITLNGTSSWAANGNVNLSGTSAMTINSGTHVTTGSSSTLTLGAGTSVQINANAYLTAGGPTVLNGSNCLVIESGVAGTGSFIDNGNISGTGTAKVQRYATMGNWHLVSSPISNGLTGIFLASYLKDFTESTNTWNDACIAPTNISLPKGKGYGLWPTSSKAFDFIGTPTTGTVITEVYYSGAGNGFNLVGNPYPSAIDWDAVSGFTYVNINDYFFIWNPADGSYGYYQRSTGLGSHGVSRYIPLGQGFFVSANAASPSFSINNSARVNNFTQPYLKDVPAATYLRITLAGDAGTDDAVIVFGQDYTQGFDSREDIVKWFGNATVPQAYTMADDVNAALNALPELTGDVVVPLYLKVGADGIYHATPEGLSSLPANYHYYLEDKLAGQIIDLNKQGDYAFNAKTTDPADRFNVHFLKNALGINDPSITSEFSVFARGTVINITCLNTSSLPARVAVYDMTGRLMTSDIMTSGTKEVNVTAATGYCIIRITGGREVTTKIIPLIR